MKTVYMSDAVVAILFDHVDLLWLQKSCDN